MRSTWRHILLAVVTIAGCGGGSDAGGITHYRLTAGSEIRIPNVEDHSMRVERLSGTFDTVPPRSNGFVVPGSAPILEISRLRFESASLDVEGVPVNGAVGGVSSDAIIVQLPIAIGVHVSVSGKNVYLSGQNPQNTLVGRPPAFRGVQSQGGGYDITIFAEPKH